MVIVEIFSSRLLQAYFFLAADYTVKMANLSTAYTNQKRVWGCHYV
jgi:hypothetical protein